MAKTKEPKIESDNVNLKEIKSDLDKYIKKQKEDITESLSTKVDEQIELKINKKMKEEEKRILRGKNGKIIRRDIIIILLLILIGYFSYCLYDIDYFNIRIKVESPTKEKPKEENSNLENVPQEPTIDNTHDTAYYIDNYSYLIDNIMIDDEEIYDLYNTKIETNEIANSLLLKIAYKNLPESALNTIDDMLTFNSDDLTHEAASIFGQNTTIELTKFTYNNTKFMYYNNTFLGLKENEAKLNLIYQITNAKEVDDQLIFEYLIGRVSTKKELLDLDNNVVLKKYNNEDLKKYKSKLPNVKITFIKEADNYILSTIETTKS